MRPGWPPAGPRARGAGASAPVLPTSARLPRRTAAPACGREPRPGGGWVLWSARRNVCARAGSRWSALAQKARPREAACRRPVEPQRLTALRAALPLEEAVGGNHAAPAHERLLEGGLERYGFGARIDCRWLASPARQQSPKREAQPRLPTLAAQKRVMLGRRHVVAGSVQRRRSLVRADATEAAFSRGPPSARREAHPNHCASASFGRTWKQSSENRARFLRGFLGFAGGRSHRRVGRRRPHGFAPCLPG
jgi:hypothetical protein